MSALSPPIASLLECPLAGHALLIDRAPEAMEQALSLFLQDVAVESLGTAETGLPGCVNLVRGVGVELGYVGFGQPTRVECWNTDSFGILLPLSGRVRVEQYPGAIRGSNGPYFLLPASDLRLQFTEDCSVLILRISGLEAHECEALAEVFQCAGVGLIRQAERIMRSLSIHAHHALTAEQKKQRLQAAKVDLLRLCGVRDSDAETPSWLKEGDLDPRVLKAARHLCKDRPEHFDLPELCRTICMSRRGLYYVFRRNLNCTPYEYFKACQLLRVRLGLMLDRRREKSISWHASNQGFRHMSRFSTQYRELFGERPRETVQRCSRSASTVNAR